MSSFFSGVPNTVSFVRSGHQSLVTDPLVEEMLTSLRSEKLKKKEATVVKTTQNFLQFVKKNPASPHYHRFEAEDFFVMGEASTHVLKTKLLFAVENLIDQNLLSFTTKQKDQTNQALTRILTDGSIENAKDCWKEISTHIQTLCATNNSFRPNTVVIEQKMEDFGKSLLEGDIVMKYLEKKGQLSADIAEDSNTLQEMIADIFESLFQVFPFKDPKSQPSAFVKQTPALERMFNLLRNTTKPLDPDSPITRVIKHRASVASFCSSFILTDY